MRVYDGFALIDRPSGLGYKLGDDGFQLLTALKVVFQLLKPSRPLYKDVLKAVDHHLGNIRVADNLAQHSQAADGLIDRIYNVPLFPKIQRRQFPINLRSVATGPLDLFLQDPGNQLSELLVIHNCQVWAVMYLRLQLADQFALQLLCHRLPPLSPFRLPTDYA